MPIDEKTAHNTELQSRYFELNTELVWAYVDRTYLWANLTAGKAAQSNVGGLIDVVRPATAAPRANSPFTGGETEAEDDGFLTERLERLTRRIDVLKTELRAVCEVADSAGERFELEKTAEKCGLNEIEKDVLLVLLMRHTALTPGSLAQTGLTGLKLLRLFFRHDFALLEAAELLSPHAALRQNGLIVMEDSRDSVLELTFRVPERLVSVLLDYNVCGTA